MPFIFRFSVVEWSWERRRDIKEAWGMRDETTIERHEDYRLLLLIEQLQRQGKTEEEIADAVGEATAK
jgi:hypothetical protein